MAAPRLREDASAFRFLAGGGEMGALIRAYDWAETPLGSPEHWPQSLLTSISIMLTSRQPIWIGWGSDLIYFYNDAYKSIIGGRHPWALGRPTREVWSELWPEIGPMLARAMGGVEGTYVEEQLLIMERNGYPEETYYTFSYSPIPDDQGAPGGIICANSEDTHRVVGERQLSLLRELAARTVDARSWTEACQQSVAALATDRKDITFALLYAAEPGAGCAQLCGAIGVDEGDPGAPWEISLADEDVWPLRETLSAHDARLVGDLGARFAAVPAGPWDRPSVQAALLPVPASSEAGQAGVLIVGLNPYRLFDDRYRGFLGLLAGQVAAAAANADAYEEERRRAEALAELDRAKTAFFSNVSHEFRTPLTLMLGPLEDALAQGGSETELRAQIALAHRNGGRLLRLVNSLLDFSRIEAGRVQARFEPTDLGRFSAEIASSFRSAFDKAGLSLDLSCDPLAELVYLDRDMWEKVLLNLLSNAFKFTLQGGVTVRVGPDPAGRGARVEVADTGIGISAEDTPRLFERFHRVEGAQGRSFEGSGIGLALVHELIRLHGGEISVRSALGQGAAFTVILPFGRAHLPADRVVESAAGAAGGGRAQEFLQEALRWLPDVERTSETPAGLDASDLGAQLGDPGGRPGSGKRIVLADDNADMRSYVGRLMSAQGYEVQGFGDGEAALAAVRERAPDLVLTDVMMPRLDGFGLLRAMRSDEALARLPVIMLSARAGEEAKVEGLEAGADDYLVKPFAARELIARVNANIQLAEVRREADRRILRSEQRSQINQERLGIALSTGQVGVYEWEIESDRVAVLGPLSMLYGVDEQAAAAGGLPLQRFLDAVHPDDRNRLEAAIATAVGANGPFELECRVTGGGEERVVRVRGDVRTKPDGGRFLTGAIIDVTDDRAAQRLLESHKAALESLNAELEERVVAEVAERRLLADIVEGTDAFVQVSDMNFRWLAVNRAAADEFERIYGLRPRLGESMLDILVAQPDSQQAVRQIWARALAGEEFTQIAEFGDPELDRRCHEMKFNVLRDAAGRQIGAYQFVYDVTDRIREQERLAQAEEQLRQSQKMEAMGQLTGGVAHDFNNLLTPIIGALDLLQRGGLQREREQRLVAGALQSADRARVLVQRLLAFARRQPLQATAVDVGAVIEGMAGLLASTTGPQVRIEIDLAPDLTPARADQNQLEMALLNLIVNARDAMPGGGMIRIEAQNVVVEPGRKAEPKAGAYVRLTVADTGAGMDEATLARAVEPFFSTKGIGKGTGLGLSMVHGLMQQLGGALTLQSHVGQGACVELWLPRSEVPLAKASDSAAGSGLSPSHGLALLVDDEELVRMSTAAMLGELGYAVCEAASAEEALALLDQGLKPDLIVTDHLMPGMTGTDFARAVRGRAAGVPVLIISGYADMEGIDPSLPRLSKPFLNAELAAAVGALH